MGQAFRWLGVVIALQVPAAVPQVLPQGAEIYLIGSVHDMHFSERYHYSLVDLQKEVLAQQPDLICGEITPEAYDAPMEGNFPPEAAMLAQMARGWGTRFVPADWRVGFAQQARGERQEASNPAKAAEVREAQDGVKNYLARFSGASLYDYTNGSAQYLAMVDRMFERVIGENTPSDLAAGAWHARNRNIVENCLTAAAGARRIVFVFGTAHLPQLRRQLAARGLVGHIPPRAFTPAGLGTMPSDVMARWRRNLNHLEGIQNGTIPVPLEDRAKVEDTNRAPVLRREIERYAVPGVHP